MSAQPQLLDLPPESKNMASIVRFAYEIGAARHKPRSWQYNLNENMANVAEHCYRVTFLAMLIAMMEGADPSKAAVIAMVHDTDEIRAMDLTPYQKPYMTLNNEKAVQDTFQGTPLADFCLALFKEYKAKETVESLCVKDADILDAVLELTEIAERGNKYLEKVQADMMSIRRNSLRTESGRNIFDMIASGTVGPWDWFLKGPSTFKDGTYGK
ncbi:MAG: HD domain-containing protein [Pseudomonadaceae bacterium]|nr:HD domain-containing protein [Pseudomonadaceae bacterium]